MLEFALGKRDRFFKLKYAEYKKMELWRSRMRREVNAQPDDSGVCLITRHCSSAFF
jgi:hypothetical protein